MKEISKIAKLRINKDSDFIFDRKKIATKKVVPKRDSTKPLYHAVDISFNLRVDKPNKDFSSHRALSNIKYKKDNYFTCPKIIHKS